MSISKIPKKPCKHCNKRGHYPFQCFHAPRKALKRVPVNKIGKDTKQWIITRATWIRKNPPTENGRYWICYLKIHPYCPIRLTDKTLTLDHVISRSRDPSLKFNLSNLKPCCFWCNNYKGSKSLEDTINMMKLDDLNK